MRDIKDLTECLDRFFSELTPKLIEAQRHGCEYILDEAKDRIEIPAEARNIAQFIRYSESLKVSDTSHESDEYSTRVYSDLYVWWEKKGIEVPVGAFLEWGTGPMGEESNDYPHGYDYTTEAPWDAHSERQYLMTGTWGITARPHLYPALMNGRSIYEANIKEAVEEAWTN